MDKLFTGLAVLMMLYCGYYLFWPRGLTKSTKPKQDAQGERSKSLFKLPEIFGGNTEDASHLKTVKNTYMLPGSRERQSDMFEELRRDFFPTEDLLSWEVCYSTGKIKQQVVILTLSGTGEIEIPFVDVTTWVFTKHAKALDQ